jgi:hypothetical protein
MYIYLPLPLLIPTCPLPRCPAAKPALLLCCSAPLLLRYPAALSLLTARTAYQHSRQHYLFSAHISAQRAAEQQPIGISVSTAAITYS